MGVDLALGVPSLFIERWAKVIDRWGNDIGQEAAVRVLSVMEQGNLKHPDRYLLTVGKQLSAKLYSDLTADDTWHNHPEWITRWSQLSDGEFLSVWNEAFSVDETYQEERSSRPAPPRIDPLRRAFEANLKEFRDARRPTEDQQQGARQGAEVAERAP